MRAIAIQFNYLIAIYKKQEYDKLNSYINT